MSNRTDHLAVLVDSVGGVTLTEHERAALDTVAAALDADAVDGLAGLLSRLAEADRLVTELAALTGRVQAFAEYTAARADRVADRADEDRQALAEVVDALAADRDRQIRRADDADPVVAARAEGGAEATRYALSTLWTHLGVGESLHVQPGAVGGDVL